MTKPIGPQPPIYSMRNVRRIASDLADAGSVVLEPLSLLLSPVGSVADAHGSGCHFCLRRGETSWHVLPLCFVRAKPSIASSLSGGMVVFGERRPSICDSVSEQAGWPVPVQT